MVETVGLEFSELGLNGLQDCCINTKIKILQSHNLVNPTVSRFFLISEKLSVRNIKWKIDILFKNSHRLNPWAVMKMFRNPTLTLPEPGKRKNTVFIFPQ